ncbi:MAG: pentapeptide repeat-containing protein [cyanobacterium endosymbiont of Rhopalodia gibba]
MDSNFEKFNLFGAKFKKTDLNGADLSRNRTLTSYRLT